MNKLREKFGNVILNQDHNEKCEQITDDFSVKFAEWLRGNYFDIFPFWSDEKTDKKYTTTELKQIFKEKYYE